MVFLNGYKDKTDLSKQAKKQWRYVTIQTGRYFENKCKIISAISKLHKITQSTDQNKKTMSIRTNYCFALRKTDSKLR